MDPNRRPPPSRLHSFVNQYINVRTAAEKLQESVRSPADEIPLPEPVHNPFFASDNNGVVHNTAAGAASGYFQNHPHEHAGKQIVFSLKTNPHLMMQATVVFIENDSILYLRDGKLIW